MFQMIGEAGNCDDIISRFDGMCECIILGMAAVCGFVFCNF